MSNADHCSRVLRYPCWRWCGVGGSSQLDLSTCFYFSYELFSLDVVEDEDDGIADQLSDCYIFIRFKVSRMQCDIIIDGGWSESTPVMVFSLQRNLPSALDFGKLHLKTRKKLEVSATVRTLNVVTPHPP
ncbi:hypothetical protein L1987_38241 [Smallanthus sonchifolius]|uniref:Uncharacterized protein n=1 Tax=Smallanthus sonchifolius TaxID=185202 RepID=A0ACB9HIM4_9ASTR|nr:hypothetical protein L1987_38241 [Smallanthus sonchifolius]